MNRLSFKKITSHMVYSGVYLTHYSAEEGTKLKIALTDFYCLQL